MTDDDDDEEDDNGDADDDDEVETVGRSSSFGPPSVSVQPSKCLPI